MSKPNVKLVEVGPRDGLQNETAAIATDTKIALINQLSQTGLQHIEASSFVHPKRIPQLADATQVFAGITRNPSIQYSALVPNEHGLTRANEAKVDAISVFTAASETFNQNNIGTSIAGSFERFAPVIAQAQHNNLPIRGYVSCAFGCPYEGRIEASQTTDVAKQLFDIGCTEVSLGDTIGVATPTSIKAVLAKMPTAFLGNTALHCHNTYGQAPANIYAALEAGLRIFDASIAGLGGCPYAEGATGNIATEDAVYLLHNEGFETGIDLAKLIAAAQWTNQTLKRATTSKLARTGITSWT